MKKAFFWAGILGAFWMVGCVTYQGSKEETKAIDSQRVMVESEVAKYAALRAENAVLLSALESQIEMLKKRLAEATANVGLLAAMERHEVCVEVLPENLARSTEILEAHAQWCKALSAPEGQTFSPMELQILERQFIQSVQRASMTEMTRQHMLKQQLNKKVGEAEALRSQRRAYEERIEALQGTLTAL